jgi:hypothetical protein
LVAIWFLNRELLAIWFLVLQGSFTPLFLAGNFTNVRLSIRSPLSGSFNALRDNRSARQQWLYFSFACAEWARDSPWIVPDGFCRQVKINYFSTPFM